MAIDALGRARTVLAKAGSVPAALLMETEADPIHGRVGPRTDWFIEPLLTPNEAASIPAVDLVGLDFGDRAGAVQQRWAGR